MLAGHEELILAMKPFFFEGFEWFGSIEIKKAASIRELCWGKGEWRFEKPSGNPSLWSKFCETPADEGGSIGYRRNERR